MHIAIDLHGDDLTADAQGIHGFAGLFPQERHSLDHLHAIGREEFQFIPSVEAVLQQEAGWFPCLGVSNGTYTKDVAANLAKELGFSQDWINNINNAADAYGTKVSEEKAQEALELSGKNFSAVMDSIASGVFDGYSVDEIKSIAAEMGITLTDKQMEHITSAVENQQIKTEQAKQDAYTDNYLSMKSNVTPFTTDKDIQEMVDSGYIGENEAGKLKEYRQELAVDEIQGYIESGDYASAAQNADKLYKNKVISATEYRKAYYDISLKNCEQVMSIDDAKKMLSELDSLIEEEKLDPHNANELKKYMYNNAFATASVTAEKKVKEGKTEYSITINGQTSNYSIDGPMSGVRDNTANLLDQVGTNTGSNAIMIEDRLYVKMGGEWRVMPTEAMADFIISGILARGKYEARFSANTAGLATTSGDAVVDGKPIQGPSGGGSLKHLQGDINLRN